MFGKKNKNTNTVHPSGNGSKPSALNTLVKGTTVEGNIRTESDIRIDGILLGDLHCAGKAIIGPSGEVKGDITCQSAVVEGQFEGKLAVAEILTLKETAVINGEANYDKLVVHQGAIINAAVRRNTTESTPSNNSKQKNKKVVNTEKEAVQV